MIVAQPRQDLFLGVCVYRRERVVQNQDPRIDGEGPRQGRSLLLPSGQRDPALAHECLVAGGKVGDVLVEPRHRGRGQDSIVARAFQARVCRRP